MISIKRIGSTSRGHKSQDYLCRQSFRYLRMIKNHVSGGDTSLRPTACPTEKSDDLGVDSIRYFWERLSKGILSRTLSVDRNSAWNTIDI